MFRHPAVDCFTNQRNRIKNTYPHLSIGCGSLSPSFSPAASFQSALPLRKHIGAASPAVTPAERRGGRRRGILMDIGCMGIAGATFLFEQ
ncbi:MAG: hypothetical protein Q7U60_00990 [Candidatus Methanoperedens sp.]|nr:hypothetical protein [Candidatus Methanoperedens sp.]